MAAPDHGFALIIGVGADLPNTIDDAAGLADILRDPARCACPPDHVRLLTGEDARRAHILAALDVLVGSTNPESKVLVFFSGHGYRVSSPIGEFYYLLPYGYDLNRLYQTAISGTEFTDRLRAIPTQKLLVLLDCCHAGGVGEAKVPGLQFEKAPLPPEARRLLAEGSGRVLIASSQEHELSYAGKPYSAFTLALIEALCGAGVAKQDGYVRVADLALHARKVVPERTGGQQHPILHFEQADNFVLTTYAGGDTQPKGVPFAGEPQIEPLPGAWRGLDQRGQTIHGPQLAIAGDVHAPIDQQVGDRVVISGDVSGKLAVGERITQIDQISGQSVTIGHEITQTIGATRPEGSQAEPIVARQTAEREHLVALRYLLVTRFDENELRTLCFDLGIDYDDLPATGKVNKARELVACLERQKRTASLLKAGKRLRPDIVWEKARPESSQSSAH